MENNNELATSGIEAYQLGNYPEAVDFLASLLKKDPSLWRCRLYLAMAYLRIGEDLKGRIELEEIASQSTDRQVRKTALDALMALQALSDSA